MTKKVVHSHFDGYPEAKLPELSAIINRDGPEKAVQTIMSARTGGWSVIDPWAGEDTQNILGNRANVVEGYGIAYADAEDEEPTYIGDGMSENDHIWIEYVYLIDPDTGEITWWSTAGSPIFKTHNPKEKV